MTYVWSANRPGQLSFAASAIIVWAGAVAAMVTKGALAVAFGASVRNWIATRVEPRIVRYVAVAAIALIGTLAVLETLGYITD